MRGAWTLYAAHDLQVTKLTVPLDSDSEQGAKNLPGAVDMLKALVRDAPVGLTQPLQEFEAISIKALNSYVHGGMVAILPCWSMKLIQSELASKKNRQR